MGKPGQSRSYFSAVCEQMVRIMQRFADIKLPILLVAIFIAMAASAEAQLKVSGTTMGTIPWNITVSKPYAGHSEDDVKTLAQAKLDRVNELMSTYIPDSEVSRFNAYGETEWFPVQPETARVVDRALLICEKSGGAFDITVGPLVNVWHFGPDKGNEFKPPSEKVIEQVRQNIGYKYLSVQLDPPALKKSNPNLQIDLSAIAKGYAVDLISEALREAGLVNHMVEVGGEVRTSGNRDADGVPMKWRIGITQPDGRSTEVNRVALLSDHAMASSGDYQQFFMFNGQRFSHVIDPRTGWPSKSGVASASIIAEDCMTADALATAAMVMGFDDAKKLCEQFKAECYVIRRVGDGFMTASSSDFPFPIENKEVSSWWIPVITLAIFVGFILAMSVGVMFSNRRIQGSCGGLNAMEGDHGESACSVCSNPSSECRELKEAAEKQRAAQEETADS